MKTKLIATIFFILMLVSGCAGGSGQSLLQELPQAEFKKFSYHRGGNITSATIIATDSKITGDEIVVESVNITADYGPAVNFNIQVEGYRRKISKPEK